VEVRVAAREAEGMAGEKAAVEMAGATVAAATVAAMAVAATAVVTVAGERAAVDSGEDGARARRRSVAA